MKFRPMLNALESREVPSVVVPEEPTNPPPYTPPGEPGTPPSETPVNPTPVPSEPVIQPAEPVTPDDKPKQLTDDDVVAELEALKARTVEIDKATEDLKKELDRYKATQIVNNVSLNAAKAVVDAAQTKSDAAKKSLDDFEKANPHWANFAQQKDDHDALAKSKDLAQAELKGAKDTYAPLLVLANNIQQRVDALNQGIKNLDDELKLIKQRIGEILLNTSDRKPIYAIPPIPKAVVPVIDAGFKDWTKPLTAPK